MGRVKIAISVAVGPLNKWGYQHVCQECLASQAEFADRVYVVQSTRDATGTQELLDRYSNIVLLSSPSTWIVFTGETDGVSITMAEFTTFHMRNLNLGRLAARDDGCQIVLSTHNNWYIPRQNIDPLRRYCEVFGRSGETTGRTWSVAQLHDKLIGPASYNYGLCNMTGKRLTDVLAYYPDMKWRHPSEAMPGDVGDVCMVDCSYTVLPSEFEGMQRRFGYPGHQSFDWAARRADLAGRTRRRNVVLDAELDYWGKLIAAKSGPEFAGYQILQEAGLL